ncbi:MAG: hypothetical protein Q9220_007246 [cf. Caloplaca sp. 1 TL-2023]
MTFRFLDLPAEIRLLICTELLAPRPSEVLTIYNNIHGTHLLQNLSLYPQILRTNRKINREATPILYRKNRYEIDFTSQETALFGVYPENVRPCEVRQALFRDDEPDSESPLFLRQPGLIYPRCLHRMAHVQIAVSPDAVWARGRFGDHFSFTGQLFQTLLQFFAHDDAAIVDPNAKRTLTLRITKDIMPGMPPWPRMALFPRTGDAGLFTRMGFSLPFINDSATLFGPRLFAHQICPLVEKISKKRDVVIVEVVTELWIRFQQIRTKHVETREVSLEDLETL